MRNWIQTARFDKLASSLKESQTPLRGRNISPEEETAMCSAIADIQMERLAISPGDHVLDVGCSEGYFTRRFAEVAESVAGVDISPKTIEIAIDKRKEKGDITYLCGSVLDLDFEDASFDKVVCFSVLQYLNSKSDSQKAFNELARVLKPGGMAYVGDVYSDKSKFLRIIYEQNAQQSRVGAVIDYVIYFLMFSLYPPILFYTPEEFREFGKRAGLTATLVTETIDAPYKKIGFDVVFTKDAGP